MAGGGWQQQQPSAPSPLPPPTPPTTRVQVLSLRGLRDWKQLELFEREAATLRALDAPGVPK